MGKMKNGILDAFSGTIGKVVGTSWRGVAVMRSKAHSRKNANTPKQQEQKAKFKVAADFTQPACSTCRRDYQETNYAYFQAYFRQPGGRYNPYSNASKVISPF
jgi:hypothetical protein